MFDKSCISGHRVGREWEIKRKQERARVSASYNCINQTQTCSMKNRINLSALSLLAAEPAYNMPRLPLLHCHTTVAKALCNISAYVNFFFSLAAAGRRASAAAAASSSTSCCYSFRSLPFQASASCHCHCLSQLRLSVSFSHYLSLSLSLSLRLFCLFKCNIYFMDCCYIFFLQLSTRKKRSV